MKAKALTLGLTLFLGIFISAGAFAQQVVVVKRNAPAKVVKVNKNRNGQVVKTTAVRNQCGTVTVQKTRLTPVGRVTTTKVVAAPAARKVKVVPRRRVVAKPTRVAVVY